MALRSERVDRSIRVNGRERMVAAATLAELLVELGHEAAGRGIAVALNGEVVPRRRWSDTGLSAGDAVEIVGAVQGG
jgi:sulfur carrier protein